MEVLLRLVEERKLHISLVSLAGVAESFIDHVKRLENEAPKDILANFIVVASTLMLIKSRSLLPELALTEDEEANVHDLETRLKLYQRVKELSAHVRARWQRAPIFFAQADKRPATVVFTPTAQLTLANVLGVMQSVLAALPKLERLPQAIVQKVITLEEAITDLVGRVNRALKLSFRDFIKDKKERVNVIVAFLGMLELVRQGVVSVEQSRAFHDISIEPSEARVPHY